MIADSAFERSIREQIAINQARTPSERFQALCDLLDAIRAMAPMDPESVERRRRVQDEADVQDILTAYDGKLDLDFIRAELETFSDPDDPRRSKFEAWVQQCAGQ